MRMVKLAGVVSALLAAQARLQATRDRVQSLGALPRQMQLEQDLNTIAELARAHDLSLSHVAPVATTTARACHCPTSVETRYPQPSRSTAVTVAVPTTGALMACA